MPPKHLGACKIAASKDAGDASGSDAKNIALKVHPNWGHASAQHLRKILVNAEGANRRLLDCVAEVLNQCKVRQPSEKAPRLPVALRKGSFSFQWEDPGESSLSG